jgi:hypothetical protein
MPIPDHEQQFEAELKRFTPREVAPLPKATGAGFRWRAPMAAAAVVILAVIGTGLWHVHKIPGPSPVLHSEFNTGGVTLGRAQAALTQAPSFEQAIDALERASRAPTKTQPHGNRSAFQALASEE